jgi:hypothetical protein
MTASTHIIGRQNIHLRYNGARDPFALRQLISEVCSDELPVRLNKLLDQYDDPDYVLRIGKLNVSLSLADDGNLQENLAKAIIEKVEAELRQRLETRMDAQLLTQNFARTLRIYLERGYLPRYTNLIDANDFRQALAEAWQEPALQQQIVPEIVPVLRSIHARQRLLSLLSENQFESFVLAMQIWPESAWKAWKISFERIEKVARKQQHTLNFDLINRYAVLETISLQPVLASANLVLISSILKELLHRAIVLTKEECLQLIPADAREAFPVIAEALIAESETSTATPIARPHVETLAPQETIQEDSESPQDIKPDEAIFIQNAGLVLLALYLPAFFNRLNVLSGDGKVGDLPRAMALLRYLVFESDDFEEMELVLEKLLCGIPLVESIAGRHNILDEEEEQAHELLQSVIEHWTILKNTTPAGLRHSFLQREGKLSFRNNQWELTVHRQAHDILLDYLPWSISMIKLQWMPHLLVVKWNK